MAIAPAQNTTPVSADTSATTIAVTFGSNNTAGNFLICGVAWADGGVGNAPTVTDTLGNTWVIVTGSAQFDTPNGQGTAVYVAHNIAGGANTVTATFGTTTTYRRIAVGEYSGVALSAAVDVSAKNIGTSTTATDSATSTAATTTVNGDLIWGFWQRDGNTVTTTPGTGFTARASLTDLNVEYLIQSTAGSIAATWTTNAATTYLAHMVAVKDAGGSPPPPAEGATHQSALRDMTRMVGTF